MGLFKCNDNFLSVPAAEALSFGIFDERGQCVLD